jgi:hypothetical protein
VNSEARPDGTRSDRCLIPDLRGVALGQLASRAAAGEKEVTGVVSRIAESRESPSGVAVLMFNNSI